jgi:hypothetical protein
LPGAPPSMLALRSQGLYERHCWAALSLNPLHRCIPTLACLDQARRFAITRRLARRFGWQGLAVYLGALTVFGPFRDYWWMAKFPEWGTYATGMAPGLAISANYFATVAAGHAVMRLMAGPARNDRLARLPWVPA